METRKLALEIRALPNAKAKLGLAISLSNFATEGDFGRDTLHDVAVSITDTIREKSAPCADFFAELARLVHYEGVDLNKATTLSPSHYRS